MPLYYYSLDEKVCPTQDGERLADDSAARVAAIEIEADLNRNRSPRNDWRQGPDFRRKKPTNRIGPSYRDYA
jgi:hypothetical protein